MALRAAMAPLEIWKENHPWSYGCRVPPISSRSVSSFSASLVWDSFEDLQKGSKGIQSMWPTKWLALVIALKSVLSIPSYPFLSLSKQLWNILDSATPSPTQTFGILWPKACTNVLWKDKRNSSPIDTNQTVHFNTFQSSIHLENGWKWMKIDTKESAWLHRANHLLGFMGIPWNYNSRLPFSPHQIQSLRHASRILKNLQRFLKPSCTFMYIHFLEQPRIAPTVLPEPAVLLLLSQRTFHCRSCSAAIWYGFMGDV